MYSKNTQISNVMKIHTAVGSLVPCGQTDMTKLIVAFHKFFNVPHNGMKRTTEIKHISINFTTTIHMAAG